MGNKRFLLKYWIQKFWNSKIKVFGHLSNNFGHLSNNFENIETKTAEHYSPVPRASFYIEVFFKCSDFFIFHNIWTNEKMKTRLWCSRLSLNSPNSGGRLIVTVFFKMEKMKKIYVKHKYLHVWYKNFINKANIIFLFIEMPSYKCFVLVE